MKDKKKIKREHFQNLVAVALADDVFDDDELVFFTDKAVEFGISHQEVDYILRHANELEFKIPMNKVAREEQLSDAVYMAMVDGKLHEREYNLCLRLAEKLDFRKKDLDHVVELVKKLWNL